MATKQDSSSRSSGSIDVNTPYTPRRPAPVVSISINHPIATMFRKVKNFLIHKQTLFSTTFSIKITPIVAIVSLFGLVAFFGGGVTTAFTIGKSVEQKFLSSLPTPSPKVVMITPIPSPIMVSRTGTVKATYQLPPPDSRVAPALFGIQIPAQSSSASAEPLTPSPTQALQTLHYILESRNGSILFIASADAVHIQSYLNHRVLITGLLDSIKNTLTVSRSEDIEILQ